MTALPKSENGDTTCTRQQPDSGMTRRVPSHFALWRCDIQAQCVMRFFGFILLQMRRVLLFTLESIGADRIIIPRV
jgi:hypothetical protein